MREFLLGVQPVMQPHPARNPGGDCFACSLTAAMRHLFPENPPTFDEVWSWFETEYSTGGKTTDNTWEGMRRAMMRGTNRCPVEMTADAIYHAPRAWEWPNDYHMSLNEGAWSTRLDAWLRAGYVALCCISFNGHGPYDSEYRFGPCNHFVVVDGVRPKPDTTADHRQIHVVCSVKGAYWEDEMLLLRRDGAGAWWLVRRRDS